MMNPHQAGIIQDCAVQTLAGTMPFPEDVGRLIEIGVEC
jgi:hypothetical protein